MKYIEIYLNERQKELENERKKYIQNIRNDISNYDDAKISENICTDYVIYLTDIEARLVELKKLREDLIPIKMNELEGKDKK